MATEIFELFGHDARDTSAAAQAAASTQTCAFIGDTCQKSFADGVISGVCSLKPARSAAVICCPVRLYADDYRILRDVSDLAFSPELPLQRGAQARQYAIRNRTQTVAVWGKRWGGELALPKRQGGNYYVDWILALLDTDGELLGFVAVEVQSIDTTGNYRDAWRHLIQSRTISKATAGFNWENVNKRIIPQLLYKGNVLQREAKCTSGLFFVCPKPVFDKVMERVGGPQTLLPYPFQSSSITFMAYDLDTAPAAPGTARRLIQSRVYTTNIGQLANAFAGPGVMPPTNSYEQAINQAL